jgi:hypothetical protein|tara:strand:- start:264 stop:605 length:342 start_codon:yes stop_codon:yes gene_type:complete
METTSQANHHYCGDLLPRRPRIAADFESRVALAKITTGRERSRLFGAAVAVFVRCGCRDNRHAGRALVVPVKVDERLGGDCRNSARRLRVAWWLQDVKNERAAVEEATWRFLW